MLKLMCPFWLHQQPAHHGKLDQKLQFLQLEMQGFQFDIVWCRLPTYAVTMVSEEWTFLFGLRLPAGIRMSPSSAREIFNVTSGAHDLALLPTTKF